MASIFSKIISGDIPAYKVAETSRFLAFLDINPVVKGHTLVIPKVEVDNLYELEEEDYVGLHLFAKSVATGLKKTVPCERIANAVVGLEVPHAHIHLLPIAKMSDFSFSNPRLQMSPEEMQALAIEIAKNVG